MVRAADALRRKASEQGDIAGLDTLLDTNFYYTHFTGRTENKDAYLECLRTSGARFKDVASFDDVVHDHGTIALLMVARR